MTIPDRRVVPLHQAFMWDCDECGTENFCRAIELHQPAEATDPTGDYPEISGVWLHAPYEVTCKFCKRVFATKEYD